MKSSIFIPKKINVGYQTRNDTYTKRLAYVIYYDEKGKLRKETSWNSWRDKEISNDEFDNVPTEGFVLNKKVGDYDSGWNHRKAYCRIYDPRNFEFEITFENLLYILENTSSIKGKGLEGEFVYGWDGKDLILIPTESTDYKQIQEYSNIIHNNETIKGKDLIVGATYLDKNNQEYIYMGRFDYWNEKTSYCHNSRYDSYKGWSDEVDDTWDIDGNRASKWINKGKHYFFVSKKKYSWQKDYTYEFYQFKSLGNKLVHCKDANCHEEYSNLFDRLERNTSYSPLDKTKYEYSALTYEEFENYIIEDDDRYCRTKVMSNNRIQHEISFAYDTEEKKYLDGLFYCYTNNNNSYSGWSGIPYGFKTKTIEVKNGWHPTKKEVEIPVTLREIYDIIQPIYRNSYLANGKIYNKEMAW